MHQVVMMLNAFPFRSGVSATLSHCTIMNGTTLDYNKHCRLKFGTSVESHEYPDHTNGMETRDLPCINLGPTGNLQ